MKANTEMKKHPGRQKLLQVLLLCIVCILINLTGAGIAEKTGLLLYLDTIGTILAAVIGSYLPGIVVGFSTNLLKGVSDTSSIYYAFLNVMIALCAGWFAEKKLLKKPLGIVGCTIGLTLIGGGLGTLVPWFLKSLTFESEIINQTLEQTGLLSPHMAELLGNLLMDLADKIVTMVIVLVIVHLIPEKLREHLSFKGWMQEPLTDEETVAARNISCRVMSVQTKMLLVMTFAMIAISVAATSISLVIYRNSAIKEHIKLAQGVANLAASVLHGKDIDAYLTQGEAAPDYLETEQLLYSVRESSPDIQYVYVYRILEDGCHVVFDLDTEDVQGDAPGDVVAFDEAFADYLPTLLAGEPIAPIVTDESFGWLLTAYVPVYDDAGNCTCYAAADVSMKQLMENEKSFFVEMITLFLGFFILILSVGWWMVEYHIIFPVNSMALRAGTFAYNDEKARESSVDKLRTLKIHTGDEIENLYYSFLKTSEDSMHYVADIQEKTETISKMQDALIMVLADLVESRDKNTGDHIRKTAAYVKLILKTMKARGDYADQLTDKFIEDVIHSAPLHDVGKIIVSDVILNKPGRLTEEEFAKMKEHTTAGGEIIAKVTEFVPDPGYLQEARNLAEYHHEKWNGAGYPHGLAGEEIPLSARIMAVADVFDALVSRRSYKEPFTFEAATDIIREGSGSHFDPIVAEAFLSASEEARKIAEEFEKSSKFSW